MYDSKIVQLMKGLTPREISDLSYFLKSPYFHRKIHKSSHDSVRHSKMIELFGLLKEEYHQFSGSGLKKERIFEKIFPGEKYDDKKLRNLKHELTRVTETYLAFLEIQDDPIHFIMHLIQQLEKRNLDKLLEHNIKLANEIVNEREIKDEEYHHQKYSLVNKKWVTAQKKLLFGKSKENLSILDEEMKHSANNFLMISFKQLSFAHHFKHHLNLEINTAFQDHILDYYNEYKDQFESNNILTIWNRNLSLNKKSSDINLVFEMQDLLNKEENHITKEDLDYLYKDLLNYCIRNFSMGEKQYKDVLFDLLKTCLDKGMYLEDNYIHENDYTNIAAVAMRLNEMEFAKDFIENFAPKVIKENRKRAYSYNLGAYYYKIGNYEKSLEMLSRVKSKDFYYLSDIYNLQLRIYYQMDLTEQAFNLIDSYKHFITKNILIPSDYQVRYRNFLKYYEALLKIKEGTSRTDPGILLKKIKSTGEVELRGWLINKLEKLMV